MCMNCVESSVRAVILHQCGNLCCWKHVGLACGVSWNCSMPGDG